MEQGLNCPNGGNFILHDDEVPDTVAQLASVAYSCVLKEPVVPEQGEGDHEGLFAIWQYVECRIQRLRCCLTSVLLTLTPSHTIQAPFRQFWKVQLKQQKAKRRKACTDRQADFTLFICSADDVIREAVK